MIAPLPLPPFDINLVVKNIGKLPSPSAIIAELLTVIDDENISSAVLARIIMRDQAIVVRLLRLANSSFYGMSGRVESISDAIAVLGLRTVRTLAAGVAIAGRLAQAQPPGQELKHLWRHCITSAVAARILAKHLQVSETAAFIAGLIHDIGELMLTCVFPDYARAITDYRQLHAVSARAAEMAILGMDHARIGGVLAERWHFPGPICNAIANHHNREALHATPLTHAVYLASELALILEAEPASETQKQMLTQVAWDTLQLGEQSVSELLAAIALEAEPFCEVLDV